MAEPVLARAAAVLEEQSEAIVARWLERLPGATPSLPRDICLAEARNAAPEILRGIAQALRLGQPEELEAPWTAAARQHAELRLQQKESLRDLLREFQLLRQEIWAALAQHLRPVSAGEVFLLARSLGAAMDSMATNSARTYGEEQVRIAERAERLRAEAEFERRRWQATVENMLDPVTMSDAEGHATYMNEAYFRLLGIPIQPGLPVSEHPRYYRIYHPDGTPFKAEDLPLQRAALRNEQVRGVEVVHRRADGTEFIAIFNASPLHDEQGRVIGAVAVGRDVTEQRRAERERERLLRDVERRAGELDATINAIGDGLIIVGPQTEILRMNEAGQRILGVGLEWARLPLAERLRVTDARTPANEPVQPDDFATSRALRGERVVGYRMSIRRPDGDRRQLLASASPIRDEQGHIVGAVLDFDDITSLIRLQEQREDILRAVSHDLRNPLAGILGQAQLCERRLAQAGLERERANAQTIIAAAQRMNTLIQDLVDTARSETGQLQLRRQPVDLAGFVAGLKERLSPSLDMARVELRMPERLPPVWADPDRLERILTNLLSNALKYSTPGTPVTVSASERDGEVVTSVTDRGPGIAPEDLERLFRRYARARPAREGVGLGLYITRQLVEAHGGRVWAESQVGVGSTFSFSLPIARA